MKVKLVFQKSYINQPSFSDCFAREVEIELPAGYEQAHIIAARCYQPELPPSTLVGGDINTTVLSYNDESKIVGKLLTYVEATYSDKEQREAQKSILKETIYGFFNGLREDAIKIVDAHKPQ